MSDDGIRMKYVIQKADGSPCDPDACYFVLRLDTQPESRAAMRAYAEATPNKALAADIFACLAELEQSPCGCREANCPHEPTFAVSRVWRYGEAAPDPGRGETA